MISDLTTDAFLDGLRRFFARRGLSLNLYLDNATNFIGANNELKRVAELLQSQQHFWKRWTEEYLNQLNVRSKCQFKKAENIKIGTMVLLKEDNTHSLHWPLGRIVNVFPGDDGIVRVISVKTYSGVYKRAVTRVVPLPI